MKYIATFSIGLVLGVLLTGLIASKTIPNLMLTVDKSALAFDETVYAIDNNAREHGWTVSKIYDIQKSLHKAGHLDINRIKVLSMCRPDHAGAILSDDDRKPVAALMPCRIGVYETADGSVYLTRMNVGLMSKMFGGVIQDVMARVQVEQQAILENIIAPR